MIYQALLFCPDEKTSRVVQQVLSDLEFGVEVCAEPFAAVKKLTVQRFDAVVVDCDNEQNATLMFKSARNSSFNQSSLTVAIVDGQSGVAKAFRIGANLVLAKPINVEQSKGTLRVARGLLRKADAAAKPAAAASSAAALSAPAARAAASASLSSSPAASEPPSFDPPSPALPSLALSNPDLTSHDLPSLALTSYASPSHDAPNLNPANLDQQNLDRQNLDPAKFDPPSPNPPLPAHGSSAAGAEWPVASAAHAPKAHKHYPWEPAEKPAAEPVASALPHAPEAPGSLNAALGGEPQPSQPGTASPRGNADGTGSGAGAGAATRRAKQIELPPARTPASEPSGAKPSPARGESPAGKTLSAESPRQGAIAAAPEAKKQAPASSKGKVLGLVAVLLLAAAAYFAWTEMHPSPAPSGGQKPTAAVTASPTAELSNADSSKPSAMVSSSITSETAEPEAELAPSHDPSTVSQAAAAEVRAAPAIAVAKPQTASRPATLEPPPSQALNLSSESADKAIAGIVSSSSPAAPLPVAGPLLVSEGSTEALLVKKVSPVYPDEALVRRIEGSVALEANISSNGDVTDVKVTSGDEILGRAASDAVKQWKYKPYYLNSQPVAIRTQIKLNFKLPN
jgi:protein TonB